MKTCLAAALSPPGLLAQPQHNAAVAVIALRDAVKKGVQAAVLPELFLSGASCGDLFAHSLLTDASAAALNTLRQQTAEHPLLFAVGLPLRADGILYNAAAVLYRGKLLGFALKQDISSAQRRWFLPGEHLHTLRFFDEEIPVLRSSFAVDLECGQLLAAVGFNPAPASQDAQLSLCMYAETEHTQSRAKRLSALCSGSTGCAIAFAGSGVWESTTDGVYAGACLLAAEGKILQESPLFERTGTSVFAPLPLQGAMQAETRKGESFSARDSAAEPDPAAFDPNPFVPRDAQERTACCETALAIQSTALAARMERSGLSKLILGLSGGLDSTLALLVCTKTLALLRLPDTNLLCVTMPGFGTTQGTRQNAHTLAACFGASLREIDIKPACLQHMRDIGQDMHVRDVTYENIQARERTEILMNLANKEQAILVGPGDMSELALGWCTYNGDHMSMYGVNAGVPKTLVRALVQHCVETAVQEQTAAVLQRVLETPVSPELLPPDENGAISQKTEDTLGSYAVQDFYLYHFLGDAPAPSALLDRAVHAFAGQYSQKQLQDWLRLFLHRFFSQQFKRSCLPDGPRVTPHSLSPRGGLSMPSDMAATLWLQELE